jgi:hypothetical protein
MKKRLLFLSAVALTALSCFAFGAEEKVYTPQGRFQIIDETNICTNGTFAENTEGWATFDGETDISNFMTVNSAGDNGLEVNSLVSKGGNSTYGMYYKWTPENVNGCYVVSFKIKAASATIPATTTHTYYVQGDSVVEHNSIKAGAVFGRPYVNLFGSTGDTVTSVSDFVSAGAPLMLSDEWQTVSYSIVGDGTERTWYLLFSCLTSGIEIADVQIQEAVQGYDDRVVGKVLDMAKSIRDCYDWSSDFSKFTSDDKNLSEDFAGLCENIDIVEGTSFDDGVDAGESVTELKEVLDEFIGKYFEDYFVNCSAHTNWPKDPTKVRGTMTWGDWVATSDPGRGIGHYWNEKPEQLPTLVFGNYGYGSALGTQTMTMTKVLSPGVYVWALDGMRFSQYTSWTANQGLKIGQLQLFFDNDTTEAVLLNTTNYDKGTYVVFKLDEEKEVNLGAIMSNIDPGYDAVTAGGSFEVINPILAVKLSGEFKADQILYWTKIAEQVKTGRSNVETAKGYIAGDYFWGKNELQACLDTIEPNVVKYEALDSVETIRNTYVEGISKTATDPASGVIFEVYTNAVKDILAANRKFVAVNDTLTSLATAIENAKLLRKQRLYDAATGKTEFDNAISTAEGTLADLKATDYSEENADAVVAAIKLLNEACDAYKATLPEEAVAVIADIDFSDNNVVKDEATEEVTINGAKNSMAVSPYSDFSGDVSAFELGFGAAEPKDSVGILRIGNGSGVVSIAEDEQVTGTNIFHASFDFYFARLTGTNSPNPTHAEKIAAAVGFDFLDANEERVAGFNYSPYWVEVDYDDFGIDVASSYLPSIGSSGNDNAKIAESGNKTHFDIVIDYGKGKMYMTTVSASKTQTSSEVAIPNDSPIAKFQIKSNHTNTGRRCWFDNLKIEKITAGPVVSLAGDVNGDNKITMADANAVVNYYLAIDKDSNFPVEVADVNGDGLITMADANAIVNMFLAGE